MRTHIRYFVPGVFKGLIKDQPAVKKWNDIEYLKKMFGERWVYGVHYMNHPPFKAYAHDNFFSNQRGEYQMILEFF